MGRDKSRPIAKILPSALRKFLARWIENCCRNGAVAYNPFTACVGCAVTDKPVTACEGSAAGIDLACEHHTVRQKGLA